METKYIEATEGLIDFIKRSPSAYHVISNIASDLDKNGYTRLTEGSEWNISFGGKYYVIRNFSSVVAFRIPESSDFGYMICASHSDSPTFKIKPNGETVVPDRYTKLNTEPYGGMILSTWLDRPLSVAGKVAVSTTDGIETKLVDLNRDYCVIPNVAIHMNRSINDGYKYNTQNDMLPIIGAADAKGKLYEEICENLGVSEKDILGTDLFLYNRTQGTIHCADHEYFSAPKIDDLMCVYASKEAFISADNKNVCQMLAVFDNEEVGSGTKQGAKSTFLTDVIERISEGLNVSAASRMKAIASSMMLSADNGHAVHPNAAEKADITNKPLMNGGVLIKYNANQKYTTDSVSEALLKTILLRADVPFCEYANRSDIPGGSTLGNLSNEKLSLNTVDIGAAQLAMHSSYETAGTKDTYYLINGIKAFYETQIKETDTGKYTVI